MYIRLSATETPRLFFLFSNNLIVIHSDRSQVIQSETGYQLLPSCELHGVMQQQICK